MKRIKDEDNSHRTWVGARSSWAPSTPISQIEVEKKAREHIGEDDNAISKLGKGTKYVVNYCFVAGIRVTTNKCINSSISSVLL